MADCANPAVLDTAPVDNGIAVPLDATVSARYGAAVEYRGEPVLLTDRGQPVRASDPQWDAAQGILSIKPADALQPGTSYQVEWPALRSAVSRGAGRPKTITFQTGASIDAEAPLFQGLKSLDWDHDRSRNDCTLALEDRFRFRVVPGPASDDGGAPNLVVLLFQTQGGDLPSIDGPRQILSASLPRPGQPLFFDLPVEKAQGQLCFSALVKDLSGKTSDSGHLQTCVTTRPIPFFNGCAFASGRPLAAPIGILLIPLFGLAVRALRRMGR